MSMARHLLIAFTGVCVCLCYGLSFALLRKFHEPAHGDIAYGIWVEMTAWWIVVLLPLSIWLGELWFKRSIKGWVPHILMLGILFVWSLDALDHHPLRAALFLACACSSLLYRLLVLRLFAPAWRMS